MNTELEHKELLSALVDGELHGDELEQALSWAEDTDGLASWQLYHMVGDVLRSPDLAHHSSHDLLTGLRAELVKEPPLQLVAAPQLEQVAAALGAQQAVVALRDPAANASVFRWRMAAGFATAAAVAALGWNLVAGQVGVQPGAQLAQAQVPAGQVVQVGSAGDESVMLRDPRLDALMATHQQYASRAALQTPADFLRNASFAARGTAGQGNTH